MNLSAMENTGMFIQLLNETSLVQWEKFLRVFLVNFMCFYTFMHSLT